MGLVRVAESTEAIKNFTGHDLSYVSVTRTVNPLWKVVLSFFPATDVPIVKWEHASPKIAGAIIKSIVVDVVNVHVSGVASMVQSPSHSIGQVVFVVDTDEGVFSYLPVLSPTIPRPFTSIFFVPASITTDHLEHVRRSRVPRQESCFRIVCQQATQKINRGKRAMNYLFHTRLI